MSNLYIIPGHGDGDCGACGNGFQEAERVRVLAQRIKDLGGNSVKLCDPNLNARESNVIGKGLVPKGYKILELHIDSSPNTSAKGGHVIIHANFKADKYDKALAKMISGMFPGRSQTIVGRTDLANLNRAASMGYNYRLMECCFISNAEDVKKFNSKMDELAKGILNCFGIKAKETSNLKAENKVVQNTASVPKVKYYAKYTGKTTSIVTALNSLKITSSFEYRKKIAKANNITSYTGTAAQNTKMLNLLKQGKLIKA
jgi:hypothetical protein